jgi:hypothetical protein
MRDLIDIQRRPVEDVLKGLRASRGESVEAGQALVRSAADFGLGLRDYLTLSIDTRAGENANRFAELSGYEAALAHLNLPIRNDFENGIVLQAASETFQTFPGTRAMFPEVIDDVLRFKNRQDQIESVLPMLAQSRTIAGTELISTLVEDDSAERDTFSVPELARIPVRTIRTSQQTVGMYKHGSAYRTSYEFNRRASLDLLTPYAARVARELEISKAKAAVSVLINGDGVNGAAATAALSAYGGDFANGKTLQNNYKALAKFLMERAKDGKPVDMLVGNFDTYVELMFMFAPTNSVGLNRTEMEALTAAGGPMLQLPIMGGAVQFAVSSAVPANKLIAFTKAETLEELVEAGSSIAENERSILNQSITYVRTEVTGYKLAFGDTRTVLTTNA